ncbi:2-oxoacid dehydrogenases acyltransferase-domain-containing protein [Kalaharituber pfeilii]|nr:2-oxoacid dehydrogenases acyltransferase-domain-containing protein [Kalaharituber pfeilii]
MLSQASRVSRKLALQTLGRRKLHFTPVSFAVKPFILADIGEGIRECEVIQWFVQPGARVEQFDKLCEVQSDKASVEITSRFDGVIKKLYYEAGDMALVGKPLVDIDIEGEIAEEASTPVTIENTPKAENTSGLKAPTLPQSSQSTGPAQDLPPAEYVKLATPAVRRICKERGVDISQVTGTGKDGRVMKEDVMNHVQSMKGEAATAQQLQTQPKTSAPASQSETVVPLTHIQSQMFKTMAKSLSIPHFMFSDEVHLDPLTAVRSRINSELAQSSEGVQKLSYMPFFIKAISLALAKFPILNSRVNMESDKPSLVMRSQHNIGVAMDTPMGLLVPNIKNVQNLSILEIAAELQRLREAGAAGKIFPADLKGGTITISNIGSIGGRVVAPVIVNTEVAILGIGKAKTSPAFGRQGEIVPKTDVVFSWSADHRVIDGATMARMGTLMKNYVENPDLMLARMK